PSLQPSSSLSSTDLPVCTTPFFCASCWDPHPKLHSFPTRRSSDLRKGDDKLNQDNLVSIEAQTEHSLTTGKSETRIFVKMYVDRSEEHTSELQSRENLVCRLLLEKKKAKLRLHVHMPCGQSLMFGG